MILDEIKATLNASSESLQKKHSANKQYPYLHLSREKIQFKKNYYLANAVEEQRKSLSGIIICRVGSGRGAGDGHLDDLHV